LLNYENLSPENNGKLSKIDKKFNKEAFDKGECFPTIMQDEDIPMELFESVHENNSVNNNKINYLNNKFNYNFSKELDNEDISDIRNYNENLLICEKCKESMNKPIYLIPKKSKSLKFINETNEFSIVKLESIFIKGNEESKTKSKNAFNNDAGKDSIVKHISNNTLFRKKNKNFFSKKERKNSYKNCNINNNIKIKNIQISNIDSNNNGDILKNINYALENAEEKLDKNNTLDSRKLKILNNLKNFNSLQSPNLAILENFRESKISKNSKHSQPSSKSPSGDTKLKKINNILHQPSKFTTKKSKTKPIDIKNITKNYLLSPVYADKFKNDLIHIDKNDKNWKNFKKISRMDALNNTIIEDLMKVKNTLSKENESEIDSVHNYNHINNNKNKNNLINANSLTNLIINNQNNPLIYSNNFSNLAKNKFPLSKILKQNKNSIGLKGNVESCNTDNDSDKMSKLKNLISGSDFFKNKNFGKNKNISSLNINDNQFDTEKSKNTLSIKIAKEKSLRPNCSIRSLVSSIEKSKNKSNHMKIYSNTNKNKSIRNLKVDYLNICNSESNRKNNDLSSLDDNPKICKKAQNKNFINFNQNSKDESFCKNVIDKFYEETKKKTKGKSGIIIKTRKSLEFIDNKLDNIFKMLKKLIYIKGHNKIF
jgi:hypothetical protein